jgi:hypothetical protein
MVRDVFLQRLKIDASGYLEGPIKQAVDVPDGTPLLKQGDVLYARAGKAVDGNGYTADIYVEIPAPVAVTHVE